MRAVEKEAMDPPFKLLNNDRLRSPINDEVLDSSAKKAISKQGTGA